MEWPLSKRTVHNHGGLDYQVFSFPIALVSFADLQTSEELHAATSLL